MGGHRRIVVCRGSSVGLRLLWVFIATSLAAAAAGAACTETPSSFPPCILDSPCPDAAVPDDAGGDGTIAEDATDATDGASTDASTDGSD